ncbi:MAG: PD40 domain-containing protein, partial [Bacteroidia bacterium]|nr:PD40 domain-containing protein [Bacteroidia bacterium]
LKTSSDGRYSVYVANNLGKYKVYLYDHERKKRKRILKSGYRSYAHETDISFPVLAWHPTGQMFAVIRERKGKLLMGTYTLETKKYEETPLFNFEKVLDFSYSDDGQSIVMSGIQKGQSDIFVFNLRTRVAEQITKDFFDDLNPHFIDKSRAIVFSSNRLNDTLGVDNKTLLHDKANYDVFYYDYKGQSTILRRITNTPRYNELQPMQYDSSAISYLSDENGIVNRYVAHLDSALSFVDTTEHYRMIVDNAPLTNYARSILSHDVNHTQDRISEIVFSNGKFHLYVGRPRTSQFTETPLPKTLFRNEEERASVTPVVLPKTKTDFTTIEIKDNDASSPTAPVDSNAVNIDNYIFQSEFPKSKKKSKDAGVSAFIVPKDSVAIKISEAANDSLGFQLPKQRNYEIAFSSTYFVSQLDNSLLNQTYQIFNGGSPIYYNPGINGFFKLGISDLLEDYRITGGFKLAFDLNSNEYYLSFEYLKKRMDQSLTFYRQATMLPEFGTKQYSHELRYGNKYPFSDVSSLRGSIAYRNDKIVTLSYNQPSLEEPDRMVHWTTARLEYVFDNTISMGLNLFNGTRFKIFGEYYKQVNKQGSGMVIVGADFRHYLKIHRELIWANRFAASTSFGSEKLIYYMGGTDNWISPGFNISTPIDYSQNYYFQALASNLRGFDQNIRNGNSFALVNSEIRWPVFKYLLNRPIKSDFVRNFQIIGFGDVGTAWNGASPYDSTNMFNRSVISNTPFVVTVVKQNEPIVAGYGFGLRTRILGYFMRADWAWGVENRDIYPSKFYFSLGLDF